MKVSNIAIATVVAISTAGAVGLAYAQSSYSEPQPGTSAPTTRNAAPMGQDATPAPGMRDQGGDASQGSRSSMSQDSPDSTETTRSGRTYNERVARADRN